MISRIAKLSIFALGVVGAPSMAEVYKWVDKAGNVHFGDQPPAGERAVKERITTTKGAAPAAVAKGKTALEKELELKQRLADKGQEEKKNDEERKKKAAREAECTRMRASFNDMSSGMRLFDYDKTGERYLLSEEQHEKAASDLRRQIDKNCK